MNCGRWASPLTGDWTPLIRPRLIFIRHSSKLEVDTEIRRIKYKNIQREYAERMCIIQESMTISLLKLCHSHHQSELLLSRHVGNYLFMILAEQI